MNWKYQIGKYLHRAENGIIRLNSKFIRENFPYGRDWMLDVKRILGNTPAVIIDAGANIGSISTQLNYWFPNAAIYAFEPIKSTFEQLVKNTSNKRDIHPLQLGLGSKTETLEILLSSEPTVNSLKVT